MIARPPSTRSPLTARSSQHARCPDGSRALPVADIRIDASSVSAEIPALTRRQGSRRPMQETPYSPKPRLGACTLAASGRVDAGVSATRAVVPQPRRRRSRCLSFSLTPAAPLRRAAAAARARGDEATASPGEAAAADRGVRRLSAGPACLCKAAYLLSRSMARRTATTPSGLSWAAMTASTGRLVSTASNGAQP